MNRLNFLMADLPEDVNKTVYFGDYDKALEIIDLYLQKNVSPMLRNRLIFEKDRIRRLEEDYIYDYNQAFEKAKKEIEDLTDEEFVYLKDQRYSDWIYKNGEVVFASSFLGNIKKVNLEMKDRYKNPRRDGSEFLDAIINKIIDRGEIKYLLHAKQGLKLKEEDIRQGEKIRVHLPIPKEADQISDIKIINTSHEPKSISNEHYPQRTIYFEEILKDQAEFSVEYSFINHIKYNNPSPENVSKQQPSFYTEEHKPHVRFTPFLVDLAKSIVKDETNPLIKARKIYDYITQNVQYTFVRQYGAITNIPEYAAYNLKGDCGVQALLFITLCRIVNVPARWQSGLVIEPEFIGSHDWAQFYVEPYGWLFADLSYGGSAYQKGSQLRWNYYFGNLDPFRMVANTEFHYDFYPEKKFLRYDPYDNQDGELEYMDRPLARKEYLVNKKIIQVREI